MSSRDEDKAIRDLLAKDQGNHKAFDEVDEKRMKRRETRREGSVGTCGLCGQVVVEPSKWSYDSKCCRSCSYAATRAETTETPDPRRLSEYVRVKLGLSQARLAELLGVSRSMVRQWAGGKPICRRHEQQLLGLAERLGRRLL